MAAQVIGRNAELVAVEQFLESSAEEPTGLVFFGEPGIGKTALWRASLAVADGHGMRILSCTPAESERALALGGLTDLLAEGGDDELRFLPAVQREAVETALLRGAPDAAFPDRRALSVATPSFLRELASDKPLLIAVDDAQWLDDSSSAVLAYAIRRIREPRLRVMVTVRGQSSAAPDVIAAMPRESLVLLEVGPLPLAALHQICVDALGRSFPRLVLVRIEEASGGNPFYALELARALVESGAPMTPGEHLPVPGTLRELVAT